MASRSLRMANIIVDMSGFDVMGRGDIEGPVVEAAARLSDSEANMAAKPSASWSRTSGMPVKVWYRVVIVLK